MPAIGADVSGVVTMHLLECSVIAIPYTPWVYRQGLRLVKMSDPSHRSDEWAKRSLDPQMYIAGSM